MHIKDTSFATRLQQTIPQRKEFVLEKLQAINTPVSKYRSAYSAYPRNYSVLEQSNKDYNDAIIDFVIAAWLALECRTARTPEQIKQRFDEIKWLREHHQIMMPGYKAVCFKKDSRYVSRGLFSPSEHYDYSLSGEVVPDYVKGRYEQIAENFVLSTPQEQQQFIYYVTNNSQQMNPQVTIQQHQQSR